MFALQMFACSYFSFSIFWLLHIKQLQIQHLSKFKRVLVETQLASPENVNIDHKRGFVYVHRVRVAEWKQTQIVIDPAKLKDVNINVEIEKIQDALAELVSE